MKEPVTMPKQEYLKECFDYDKETGLLAWINRPRNHFRTVCGMNTFNAQCAGRIAGRMNDRGYIHVNLSGQNYLAHRIIWKLVTGNDPICLIDHADNNTKNNKWLNLREADKQKNAFNSKINTRNKTGFKGVSFDKLNSKYLACIREDGKTKYLGLFENAKEAHDAYVYQENKIKGVFAYRGYKNESIT